MTSRRHKSRASDQPSPSADWKKLVEEWVWKRFGLTGVGVLAVVFAGVAIWWQWDQIVKLPGIADVVQLARRERLPKADPNLFSIAVAHLEGDANYEKEGVLVDALLRFAATERGSDKLNLQILHFDRTIELKGGDLEIEARKGHEAARRLLAESGADVLLWGRVLREGNQTRHRLFWTPARATAHGKATDLYAVQEFELPTVFWTDLAQWLGLLVESQAAELSKLEGQYAVSRLTPFIERTRKLLNAEARQWDADTRAKVRLPLAYALRIYGEQAGTPQPLEEAVTTLQEALKERTRERAPLDWAMTQNNLGNALLSLGEQETGTARLEAAVTAYQEALKEYTRDRVPLEWASTQNNLGVAHARLGVAHSRLGEQEASATQFEKAVTAFQNALQEWTRERVPLDWAMTQNNLGNTQARLGEQETGTARLEAAMTAYQEALKEYTRERVPLDWAMTQNNLGVAHARLGVAHWRLGEQEASATQFEKAVTAFQSALQEWTRKRIPLKWANTQSNLGSALARLGEQETGTARLEAAVTAYQEALKEYTRDRVPLEWANTQNNLGSVLARLGEREADTVRLEAAVTAFQEALQVWGGTSEYNAKIAQDNLQHAQATLDNMRANKH
jgi:tetratricopeptide (TPR) repeat protein